MASKINRENRVAARGMTSEKLRALVEVLEPQVRKATSLLECAKQELDRRASERKKRKEVNNAEPS